MGDVDFYETVSERGDLDPAAADEATMATLSALGDHLGDSVVEDLVGPLPDEVAEAFLSAAADPPSSFSYTEFLDRVADRLDVGRGEAERRARAVGSTLRDHADDAELADAREQLPDAFDRLFWVPSTTELLETVRAESELSSADEAREATAAVLATLGERITPGEAATVAAYLPDEFATALLPEEDVPEGAAVDESETVAAADTGRGTDEVAADYDVDEFVERVAEREGVSTEAARSHVGAVSEALTGAIPAHEFEDVLEQLPREYGAVL